MKGIQASTEEEESLNAEDKERGWKEVVAKLKGDQLADLAAKVKAGQDDDAVAAAGGTKWQQALEKLKAQKALQNAEKTAGTATTGKSKWQTALEKTKANNFKNLDDVKATAVDQNKWQAAVAKIQAGKLTKLDTTNNKWQGAFNKLNASGQLKNVDEAQVVKVTEGVAQEITKAPQKSSKFKKFMDITFGVAPTGLICDGA
ncbi:hypothetical protein PHYPSEUDO_008212 [Phytophthora pseudosyringae]|uniref:RxLR effector protein n=1 Tax=Phytophthora pseudosyringae TaxID=221518 RepID=A0A8T1VK16_9STRA|nr:hypothetical protein PHYPSEUDO_008212 [Phytophthora pseudosyringae]